MTLHSEKKTIFSLAIAFLLLAVASLLSMMGFGQFHGDHWLETRQNSVKELQSIGSAYSMVLVNSQRYVVSGEGQHLSLFNQSLEDLKLHLGSLQALDGGQYGRTERVRRLSNELALSLGEIDLDVKLRQDKGSSPAQSLLLTNREMRDADAILKRIVAMEQEESAAIQAFFSGDVKARGNSLPLVAFVFACLSFVVALVELFGNRRDFEFDIADEARLPGLDAVRPLSPAYSGGASAGYSSGDNGNGNGNGNGYYGNGSGELTQDDLTGLRRDLAGALAQLERLANVDYLTDVLNVRGLEQVLRIEDNRSGRSGEPLIAMLINCDNLKKVNEGLGHGTGDVILKETAKRILGILRPSDHVARVGGDEFLVLLPDTSLPYGMRVAERIRSGISDAPMQGANDVVPVTASIGVVSLPAKIASVQEAVNLARAALKRSKAAGKNKVTVAEESPLSKGSRVTQRDIVEQLLDAGEFRTVYQPIIALASEKVDGYEVLSRGPDGAFESPADFFRICVENNILTTVDLQCLRLCLAAPRDLEENARFHVNLFPSTLLETPVDKLIELFPADRSHIRYCVEISEQEFISEPAYLRDHVNALKHAGILVAIDDVGFGRSSLETLILLEPDLVKVDRKYVAGLSHEPAKARLLRRLANVAKSLGAQIIAEGIENREDLPLLMEMGIDYGQGFLWGELLGKLPAREDMVKKG